MFLFFPATIDIFVVEYTTFEFKISNDPLENSTDIFVCRATRGKYLRRDAVWLYG